MKHNWTYKKLGEVATYVNGFAFKPSDWKSQGLPIIRIQNLNDPSAEYNFYDKEIAPKYIVNNGDILISWSASLGVYEWQRGKALLNQHIFKVVFDKSDIDKHYLKYCVDAKLADMSRLAHGATMRHIVKGDFDNTLIPYPSLVEQQAIVRELDGINRLIDLQEEQLREYDRLAQSIFYSTFGDPTTNPKGWEVKTIGDMATFINGKAHEQDIDEDGAYTLINSKYISSDGSIYKKTNAQIEPLYVNDIVMVMSDVPNGRAIAKCILIKENGKYTLNQRICAFRNYEFHPLYLLYSLNRNQYYLNFDNGNSQTNLRKDDVLGCPIMCPPLDLQQTFAAQIEAIEQQKALIRRSLDETRTLLAARMQYYFE